MSESKFYCGVDPGLTGYITVLDGKGNYVEHFKTPTVVETKKIKKRTGKRAGQVVTKTKTTLDEVEVTRILLGIKAKRIFSGLVFCVERQHPVTGQGLASTGKTMEGFGFWKGVLHGLGIPFHVVSATEWQKVVSDPKAKDKKAASVAKVKQLYKDLDLKKTKRSKVDDHNLADSVLIARYCWLTHGNH
jgi:hypothetical protein